MAQQPEAAGQGLRPDAGSAPPPVSPIMAAFQRAILGGADAEAAAAATAALPQSPRGPGAGGASPAAAQPDATDVAAHSLCLQRGSPCAYAAAQRPRR